MAEGGGVRKLVLETLSVPVVAESQVFDTVMKNVENTFLRIESHFKKMQGLSRQLAADLGVLATGISTLVAEAATLAAVDLRNLVAVGESLRLFGAKVGTQGFKALLDADYTKLDNLGRTLANLTTVSSAANLSSLTGLKDIGEQLRLFGSKTATTGFRELTSPRLVGLNRLPAIGESLRQFITTASNMDLGTAAVNIRVLSVVAEQINEVGKKLSLAGVRDLAKLNLLGLPDTARSIASFTKNLSGLDKKGMANLANLVPFADNLNEAGKKLSRVGITDLLKVNFAALPKIITHLDTFATGAARYTGKIIDTSFLVTLADDLNKAGKAFDKTGVQFLMQQKFTWLSQFGRHINSFAGSMAGVNLSGTGKVMADLQKFLQSAAVQLNPQLVNQASANFKLLGGISRSITSLTKSLNNLSTLNISVIQSNLTALSGSLAGFLNSFTPAQLAKITELSQLIALLNKSGAGRIGGGGGPRPPRPPGGGLPFGGWGMGGGGGFVHGGAFAAGSNNIAFQINLLRYGLAGLGIAATIAFSRFDDAVTRSLSMIKGATPQMRRELESVIQTLVLSGQSLASPTALAEGFQFLAQSGLNFKESVEAMRLMDQLATVTNMTMQETAETVSTIRHNWNMLAADIPHIADIIVRGGQLSRGGMEQFGEAMARLAPTASHLNLSLEDTAVALTVLGQAGIHGSDAATGLARVLNTLETGVVRNSEVWDRYNIRVANARGQLLPLPEIFTNIRNAMNRLSPLGQRQMFMELGLGEAGGTGLTRILSAFLNTSRDQFDSLKREIRGADGALKDMFATIQESFGRRVLSLWNTFLMALIKMGQILAPVLSIIIEGVKAVFQAFISIPEPIRNFAAALLVLVPAIWLFGHALVMMPIWLKALDVAMYQLFAVTLASMNPIFWFTLATAALIGFGTATDEGKAAFASMGESFATVFEALTKVGKVLLDMLPAFATIITAVAVPALQILAFVLSVLAGIIKTVGNIFEALPGPMKTVISWSLTAVIAAFSLTYAWMRLYLAGVTIRGIIVAMGTNLKLFAANMGLVTTSVWAFIGSLTALLGKLALVLVAIEFLSLAFTGEAPILDALFGRNISPAFTRPSGGGSLFEEITNPRPLSVQEQRNLPQETWAQRNLPNFTYAYNLLADFIALASESPPTISPNAITPSIAGSAMLGALAGIGSPAPGGILAGQPRYLGEFQQTSFSRFAISGPGGLSTIGRTGASAVDNPEWTRVLNKIEENTRDNPAGGPPAP